MAESLVQIPAIAPEDLVPLEESPQPRKLRLGEMLIDSGLITSDQLGQALAHQKVHGGRLGTILVTLGMLAESDLETSLGRQMGLAVADVETVSPPAELLRLVGEDLIKRYEVIPLGKKGKTLIVGMTDPFNLSAVDDLLFRTKLRMVETRLISETTFRRFIQTRYASLLLLDRIATDEGLETGSLVYGRGAGSAEETARRVKDVDPDAGTPVVVRLATYLLREASNQRASDIHIEPYETFFRVRFRVDGHLHTEITPPQRLHAPLISRIKILSGMDIAEKRTPQDGHFVAQLDDEEVQYRVSTLPTVFGEKCVIRMLRQEAQLADIFQLGLRPEQSAMVRNAAALPQGLVLVTGPTGSGKTTTVHAMINLMNDPDINIVSLEDPVEQAIPGVNHVQMQEKAGLTFASGLRSILRQDPDVIFVGEMRDQEVGSIALRGALTGHLVLSTLHTNGIVETFTRLVDMGLEPYLLASSLQLVVAQRLVRRLCRSCARPGPISRETMKEFHLSLDAVASAHHRVAVGCPRCLDTGFRGRLGVYEMVVPTPEIRELLRKGGDEETLRAACDRAGVKWMWDTAIGAVLAGETTFDEVRRAVMRLN